LRRELPATASAAESMQRTLDAVPDRIDVRDWTYVPHLRSLPDRLINCDYVPKIFDQGREGACTGFALAAVINFHLARRNRKRYASPRMLYELARRFDEWPGEDYEGSSARGAIKGWIAHGVCEESDWPSDQHGIDRFSPEIAQLAQGIPGGAYLRVKHREIRDMHAALVESGILYATLMVHQGWNDPGEFKEAISYVENGNLYTREFPIITRKGRADGGHAVTILGYTEKGFIIANSWSEEWGAGGFALLPYEDYILHATDVWVVQLGVPVQVDLWSTQGAADTTAGMYRAAPAIPLNEIRPFVIDVGNNGELSTTGEYWTTEADLERLFTEEILSRGMTWPKIRVLLYLHGGLNDERTVAQRIVAYREVMLENEIYPLHIMWETGLSETLTSLLHDLFTDTDNRAGQWLDTFRQGLLEAKDRTLELTAAMPGTVLWDEMKENARLTARHPDDKGAFQLLRKHAKAAIKQLPKEVRDRMELHIIGHSAGSIVAAHALRELLDIGIELKSLQFFAPAISVADFKTLVLPLIKRGDCPVPVMYILSDTGERDDEVGPYGKSLLYLVSNAFEGRRNTPILGMERYVVPSEQRDVEVDRTVAGLFGALKKQRPNLIVAGEAGDSDSRSKSDTHGGFDNDPDTMNSALRRILQREPKRAFEVRDLQF
jgi:hypothetical protein